MACLVFQAKAALQGLEEAVRSCALLRRGSRAGQDHLLARQQLKLALAQQETAQERVAMALQTGNAEEVQEAERKVEEAERKVQEAEKEVEKAKEEVKEAKASGRPKESEAGRVGRFRRPAAFWDVGRCAVSAARKCFWWDCPDHIHRTSKSQDGIAEHSASCLHRF